VTGYGKRQLGSTTADIVSGDIFAGLYVVVVIVGQHSPILRAAYIDAAQEFLPS
jgi:hypothetical protein